MTDLLFRDDAYASSADATVLAIDGDRVILDRTVFYGRSGGQPGDTGSILSGEKSLDVTDTLTGETKDEIVHLVPGAEHLRVGARVGLTLDWERRHRLMRMHTACHILSVVCPFPITGAAVSENDSRVDFDLPEPVEKDAITAAMMQLVSADHPVFAEWITEEQLAANPTLVKSANVRPPAGAGRIRLVCIGENSAVDAQPCGGTHVRSTGEVGPIHIGKIEKKGRTNRRFRIRFGEPA